MTYRTVSTCVDVEVDVFLEDFDTEDLIDELRSRGNLPEQYDEDSIESIVNDLYNSLRNKNEFDVQWAQRQLIDRVLGKII